MLLDCSGNHVDSECICFDLTIYLKNYTHAASPFFLFSFFSDISSPCDFYFPLPYKRHHHPPLSLSLTLFSPFFFFFFFAIFIFSLGEFRVVYSVWFPIKRGKRPRPTTKKERPFSFTTFSYHPNTKSIKEKMESWNLAPEELDWSDSFARTRRALIQCENGFIPIRESAESFESVELSGLPEMFRKTIQSTEMFCGVGGGGGELGTLMISPNSSSMVEDESGSKVSGSLMESNNSQDSSLIALKLGCRNSSQNNGGVNGLSFGVGVGESSSKERSHAHLHNQISSSSSSSLAAKRARTRGSYSQTPFCQVHGCNMDLTSSKDYHKKHRVCDVHSKTAKVIVNGIEQRFCQQCSRFHLLAEFDDGKRSCRRRLAGHNERRRKPQLDGLSDKTHKLSHPNHGNPYLGTSLQKRTPFVFSNILPGVLLFPDKYEQVNQFEDIEFEDEPIYNPQLTVPVMSSQLLSKSFVHPLGIGEQHSSSGVPTSETEEYRFHTTAGIQKPNGASNSTCALSLLSSQSQHLSSHSTGIPSASPLMMQGAHQTVGQLLNKPLRVRSTDGGANGFYSCAINPVGFVDQFESAIFPESNPAVDFEVHDTDRAFQDHHNFPSKNCLAPEHGSTVDLLQLSSHLQRVEHQRNFIQVKPENEDLCCFPTA